MAILSDEPMVMPSAYDHFKVRIYLGNFHPDDLWDYAWAKCLTAYMYKKTDKPKAVFTKIIEDTIRDIYMPSPCFDGWAKCAMAIFESFGKCAWDSDVKITKIIEYEPYGAYDAYVRSFTIRGDLGTCKKSIRITFVPYGNPE